VAGHYGVIGGHARRRLRSQQARDRFREIYGHDADARVAASPISERHPELDAERSPASGSPGAPMLGGTYCQELEDEGASSSTASP
jgi:hypothetical protein